MREADALETALAEVERTFDEQSETLDELFASVETLGSALVEVDEQDLAELTRAREPSAPLPVRAGVLGARC